MNALDELLSDLKDVCAGLVDKRQGQTCRYTMADIGLAAFSVFFMQSPSFLAHQRTLAAGHGRSNCQTLLGMSAIPSDNHIRQMLDGNTPAAFDGLFMTAVEAVAAAEGLSTFQRLDGRVLIADGRVSGISCMSLVDQARVNRSSKRMANWAFAMPHSRGGIFQSFAARFNTRYSSFSTLSSVGKWPRARTARRSLAFRLSMALVV